MRPDDIRRLCAGLFPGAKVEVTRSDVARMFALRVYPDTCVAAYLKLEFLAETPEPKLRKAIEALDVAWRATVMRRKATSPTPTD